MIDRIPVRRATALGATALLLSACGGGEPSVPELPEATPVLAEDRGYGDLEYSPDGSRITYVATEGTVPTIWVANADGSDAVRLTEGPGYAANPEWSPDGSWITFQADPFGSSDVFVVAAAGGEPRPVAGGPWYEGYPKPSPDGSRILFASTQSGDQSLWTVPVDGGEPRALTSPSGRDFNQAWSPDGRWIAFTRSTGGRRTVWLYSTADGTEAEVTDEGFENFIGNSWSPDSGEFLYLSTRTGLADVWAYVLETGETRQVTNDIRWDGNATYSPDGRWIAFRSGRGGQDDVWIVPASGGEAIRVTDDPAEEFDLRWRPDGRGLIYVQDENVERVYALDLETGATRAVTHGDDDRLLLDLSPDGTQALHGVELGGVSDIHIVPVAGGDPRPLVSSPSNDVRGRWSPDGSTIAFGSSRGGELHIYLVPAEGGDEVRLTSMPSAQWEWSPQGDRIAFTAPGPDGSDHLWVVPAAGGEPTRISSPTPVLGEIAWHPDGASLLVVAAPTGVGSIFRVPVDGGDAVEVVPPGLDAFAPSWAPDGRRFTYSGIHAERPEAGADVFVANADGTGHLRLSDSSAWEYLSFWSADGTTIYHRIEPTDMDGVQYLAGVPASGGESRRLMETSDLLNLFRRDPGTGELYFTSVPRGNRYVTVDVGELMDTASGG